jgi:hypothetical protein
VEGAARLNFGQKLERLLRILNLPVRLKFGEIKRETNVYDYWFGLGLLSREQRDGIATGERPLESSSIIWRFFRDVDYFWSPTLYRGHQVADVGSGYGYISFWLILSGAKRVLSIGDPERVEFIKKLYAAAVDADLLPHDSLISRGRLIEEGETSLLEGMGSSLALVLMNETLEHVNPRVRPWLFRACFNNLVDRGQIISLQHNSDCPRTLRRLLRLWQDLEAKETLNQRMRWFRLRLPDADESTVLALGKATRGGDEASLERSLSEFLEGGAMPTGGSRLPPINISTGEVCEGLTTIRVVLEELRLAGFEPRVYPAMRHSRRSRYLQPLAKFVPMPFLKLHIFDENAVFVGRKLNRVVRTDEAR